MADRKVPTAAGLLVAREIAMGKGTQLREAADRFCPRGIVDKLAAVSPAWRSKRDQGRLEHTIMAGGYDVTKTSRTRRARANRMADGAADNAQDDQTLWDLREICKDHDRNSALLHGIIGRGADNIASPEFIFKPNSADEKFNKDAGDLLKNSCDIAEFRNLFTMRDLVYGSIRSLFTDGDLLFNHLTDGRIQTIEAHELVTPTGGKGYNNRKVIGGIELDEQGRHAAYYVRDPREKNKWTYDGWTPSWKNAQRLPAANVQHIANRHRFSQTRGVPVLAPCLDMFDRLDGYLDSEMLAAELDSHKVTLIQRGSSESLPGLEAVTDVNETSGSLSLFEKMLRSEPGMIIDGDNGDDMKSIGGMRPTDSFGPYITAVIRMIGASIGYPLELVLLDFSQTNYSSARAALLQSYRVFMRWQKFAIRWIIQPTYNRWMSRWLASRELRPVAGSYNLMFIPPRWAWIDPLKEVLAKEKQIAAGAGTLEQWIFETGFLPDELLMVRSRELDRFKALGVPTTTAPNNLGDGGKQNPPSDESQPKPDEDSGRAKSQSKPSTKRGRK